MEDQLAIDVRNQFGKRLAGLRKKAGLSQEALALESDIARSYLGEVERGRRNLALINICRLAEALGVKPYVLLDFQGELPVSIQPKALNRPA